MNSKNLKIAIYAICKNEKQFVNKWFQSMLEADYICILDTGSDDGTYEILLDWQKLYPKKIIIDQKTYSPWRFDIPRNDSMKLVPEDADILWCTDLDEVLEPGWSSELKNNWQSENQTRGIYLYAWSHTPSGETGRIYWYDKIHTRHNYTWKFPVHETLFYTGTDKEKILPISSRVLLHHYPDLTKSRSNYLQLLELRVSEDDSDYYGKIYLAHEYMYQKMPEKCIEYINTVALPRIKESKEALFMPDLHLFLGDCYFTIKEELLAERSYRMGIASFPQYRENYIALAALLLSQKRFLEAKDLLYEMINKTKRFYSWLERDISWSFLPYDLLCQAHYFLGDLHTATDYALLAYSMNPVDKRLEENYKNIRKELETQITCVLTPLSELENPTK